MPPMGDILHITGTGIVRLFAARRINHMLAVE